MVALWFNDDPIAEYLEPVQRFALIDPWCILLASREPAVRPVLTTRERSAAGKHPALTTRDPLAETLVRACTLTTREFIGAVTAGPAERWRQSSFKDVPTENFFVQPSHHGTAYEVLLALLQLETRIAPHTPLVFLPTDHVVNDERIMTRALLNMVQWIVQEPRPVYLLGAEPEGPHDQLGYVVPWHGSLQMPMSVYEFVEKPDVRQARKLINAGGLWNTFIFGGTVASMVELFRSRFAGTVAAMRGVLRDRPAATETLAVLYGRLTAADFSHEVLANQTDALNVLRLPRCGWWPLKSPTGDSIIHVAAQDRADSNVPGTLGSPPGPDRS